MPDPHWHCFIISILPPACLHTLSTTTPFSSTLSTNPPPLTLSNTPTHPLTLSPSLLTHPPSHPLYQSPTVIAGCFIFSLLAGLSTYFGGLWITDIVIIWAYDIICLFIIDGIKVVYLKAINENTDVLADIPMEVVTLTLPLLQYSPYLNCNIYFILTAIVTLSLLHYILF